jgi:hypothetical protein
MKNLNTFDPEIFAVEYLWTLDDAMDALANINRANRSEFELTKKELMRILNDTLSSDYVMEMIMERLEENVHAYLDVE